MKKLFLSIALCLGLVGSTSWAQQAPILEFFHGAECPHCHEEKEFFPTLKTMYPDLQIKEYEIWHNPQNKALAEKRMQDLGHKLEGVPANIIEGEVIVGFQKEKILATLEKHYGPPKQVPTEAIPLASGEDSENPLKIIIGALLAVALIGGGLWLGRK